MPARDSKSCVLDFDSFEHAYISPKKSLKNIICYATEQDVGWNFSNSASLVSHTFHQIVLPYKFRSLIFQLPDRVLSCGRNFILIKIPKFWGAVTARDPHALSLAPLVQELSLLQWSIDVDFCQCKDRIPELFEEIVNSLFAFRNLTTLNMHECVITPAIMEQLGKLVQLQSLHTYRCQDEE